MTLEMLVTQYIEFRQSLGEKFVTQAKLLKAFKRELGPEIKVIEIDPVKVKKFLEGADPITHQWHRKYSTLRGLFDYGCRYGLPIPLPSPIHIPKPSQSFVPHIYTDDELCHLLKATTTFRKRSCRLESITMRTLIFLLYGAGLRVSEALAFNMEDVDLDAAVLTVRNTKFYKTRLVPFGEALSREIRTYLAKRSQAVYSQNPDSPFLIFKDGTRLSYSAVNFAFRTLRAEAGIRRTDGSRYQPRLHDLRHSFAVHRLTKWYRDGADVQRLLPKLSTYLGHTHLSGTQVYLTMIPELLQAASARFVQYAFQEVNDD
jgi:integrase/recombinase XerD